MHTIRDSDDPNIGTVNLGTRLYAYLDSFTITFHSKRYSNASKDGTGDDIRVHGIEIKFVYHPLCCHIRHADTHTVAMCLIAEIQHTYPLGLYATLGIGSREGSSYVRIHPITTEVLSYLIDN
ncbi:hypothetical protein SDC9_174565 [bioreactor metagenome]|uniref:Uncharacterized protein n=1 Tax=bioreactor metagenome TaxID=1076179 RepID=A0A645GJN6_9ZZZZ